MQILLNSQNLQAAVILFVQDRVSLQEDESLSVELTEDGAIVTILAPGEDAEIQESTSTPAGEKPQRRQRRTRQPKEVPVTPAPELAPESGNEEPASTQTNSAPDAQPSEAASSSAAGGVAEQAEEPETPVDPQPAEPAVAVEEQPAQEPEPAADPEPEVAKDPEPAPEERPRTQSLFANLRKPNNQQN